MFLDVDKFIGARPGPVVINNSEFISQLPDGKRILGMRSPGGQGMEYESLEGMYGQGG